MLEGKVSTVPRAIDDPVLRMRALHVTSENQRVRDFAQALRAVAPDLYVARGAEWATVPLLRARFGNAGRKRAEEKFSWAAIARQVQELYAAVVKK